jgi:sialate O-acetylesterase
MRKLLFAIVAVMAAAAAAAQGQAPLTFGPAFQDHAVLQRDRPIAVWGTAAPGEVVTVALAGNQASSNADPAGKWSVTLPALPAGGPHILEARGASGAAQTASDVLVGDVFLCSGQSNMEFGVGQSRGGEFAAMRSANGQIRLLAVPRAGKPEPAAAFGEAAAWKAASPDTVRRFSGACYFFGREVQASRKVPVGLISAAWGGTALEPWASAASLQSVSGLAERIALLPTFAKDEDAANQAFGQLWEAWWKGHRAAAGEPWKPEEKGTWTDLPEPMRDWKKWGVPELARHDGMVWFRRSFTLTPEQAALGASIALGAIDEVDQTWVNGRIVRNTFGWGTERTYKLPAGMLRAGENVVILNVLSTWDMGGMYGPPEKMALRFDDGTKVPLGGGWRYRMVPLSMGRPPRAPWETIAGLTTLYNGMIAPLGPYGIRAALWYQGETNADAPDGYQKLLASLMSGWRAQFGADLPFLVVQLPGFGPIPTKPVESNWAEIREAERRAVAADAHAGLAVTIDIGEPTNLHPTNKLDVGLRLARAARKVVYGETLAPSGPVPLSARRAPGRVVVAFGDVEGALVTYSASQAIGFELCGAAKGSCRFVNAKVDGTRAVLPVAAAGAKSTRVRFSWGDSPMSNLSDASGLPVGPFEIAIK